MNKSCQINIYVYIYIYIYICKYTYDDECMGFKIFPVHTHTLTQILIKPWFARQNIPKKRTKIEKSNNLSL